MRRPHPPRTPLERDIVEAEAAVAEFADKHPDVDRDRAALRQRARPRRRHRLHPDVLAAAGADGARLRPAAAVRPRGRRRPRARARGAQPDCPGSTTSPPTASSRSPRRSACSASGRCRCCRHGARAPARARCAGSACGFPDEMDNLLRFGRGVDNRAFKATGFDYGYTSREAVAEARRAPAPAAGPARHRTRATLRARGRGVPALEPARAPRARRARRGRRRPRAARHLSAAAAEAVDLNRRLQRKGVAGIGMPAP